MPKALFKPVYFAHPINSYDTHLEDAAIRFIADKVAGGVVQRVENPNQPHHEARYREYSKRAKLSGTDHKGMNYFYDEVLPKCGSCVALPYLDGKLGLGVAGEALWFLDHSLPVWYMEPKEGAGIQDIQDFIKDPLRSRLFKIRVFSDYEIAMLRADKDVGSPLLLSHEETRLRTWYIYGLKQRPYEEAHLVSLPLPEGFYPEI